MDTDKKDTIKTEFDKLFAGIEELQDDEKKEVKQYIMGQFNEKSTDSTSFFSNPFGSNEDENPVTEKEPETEGGKKKRKSKKKTKKMKKSKKSKTAKKKKH